MAFAEPRIFAAVKNSIGETVLILAAVFLAAVFLADRVSNIRGSATAIRGSHPTRMLAGSVSSSVFYSELSANFVPFATYTITQAALRSIAGVRQGRRID
ncbi:hypothetical protein [Rubripirellula obstinata]|nr:hypothetical protein [Rubripirellula obstinata]